MTKSAKLILALLAVGTLLACSKQQGPASTASAQPSSVRAAVTFLSGDVDLTRASEPMQISTGTIIQATDIIETGADSALEMMVDGYGVVKLGSQTRLELVTLLSSDSASSVELKLEQGSLASFIQKSSPDDSYSVVTPTAIAGVRGTMFLAEVDRKDAESETEVTIAVIDGTVQVSLPGQDEVIVGKDSQITVKGFQPIARNQVRPLSDRSLSEMRNFARFHQSDVLGFNNMVEQMRSSSEVLRRLEREATAEISVQERMERQAEEQGRRAIGRAAREEASSQISRDIEGDPLKLQPDSTYKQ